MRNMTTMTTLLAASGMFACMSVANAETSYTTSWEGGGPELLGTYGNIGEYGVTDEHYTDGEQSLFMREEPVNGTPQGYVGWVRGLTAGDTVTVGIWAKGMDNGSGTNSRGRLWHHYSQATDITAYAGGGNGGTDTAYLGEGGEWSYGETTFTFTGDEGEAMVIEARLYCYVTNDTVWYDDMSLTVSNDAASVEMAGVPAPGALALLGLGGLVARRRRA